MKKNSLFSSLGPSAFRGHCGAVACFYLETRQQKACCFVFYVLFRLAHGSELQALAHGRRAVDVAP
jgi:hypothetical protein